MRVKLVSVTALLTGGVVGAAAIGGLLIGCGSGDDSTTQNPTVDAGQTADASLDAALVDSTVIPDSSKPDVSNLAPDASDAGFPDSALIEDTGTADRADSALDAEAAIDTGVDAALLQAELAVFPHSVDVAYCARLQSCCQVPNGQWADCADEFEKFGGVLGSIAKYNAAFDAGVIRFDPAQAATCLAEVSAIPCGTVSAALIHMLTADCFAAMTGTLGPDAGPCINSLECTPGEFCNLGDAGTGTCLPLRTAGQGCADTVGSQDCTFLGHGSPALYCGAGPEGGTVCLPTLPLNAGCLTSAECAPNVCDSPSCVNSVIVSDPGLTGGTCDFFTLKDAGADGG